MEHFPRTVAVLEAAFARQAEVEGDPDVEGTDDGETERGARRGPVAGTVALNQLWPKTHVLPHTGATNVKLRIVRDLLLYFEICFRPPD